jgi:hypothetical protein
MQIFKYHFLIYIFILAIFLGYLSNISYASKIPVEVKEECNDSSTGQYLIFLVREALRQSAIFKLTYINEPRMYIIIHTINIVARGDIIAYSYMICIVNKPFLYNYIFKASAMGTSNKLLLKDTAMEIVVMMEKVANDAMKSTLNID